MRNLELLLSPVTCWGAVSTEVNCSWFLSLRSSCGNEWKRWKRRNYLPPEIWTGAIRVGAEGPSKTGFAALFYSVKSLATPISQYMLLHATDVSSAGNVFFPDLFCKFLLILGIPGTLTLGSLDWFPVKPSHLTHSEKRQFVHFPDFLLSRILVYARCVTFISDIHILANSVLKLRRSIITWKR